MGVSEYGAKPLFPGAVARGMRTWQVDRAGRLYGMSYPQPWKAGENKATCYSEQAAIVTDEGINQVVGGCSCGICAGPTTSSRITKMRQVPHPISSACMCGYYAITEGHDNEYMHTVEWRFPRMARIEGIVEGYGSVVIGSKGFRAEKARIVALVISPSAGGGAPLPSWRDLTPEERQRRRCECESLPERFASHPISNKPHMTHDLDHEVPDGVYVAGGILYSAYHRGCICLKGLAEEVVQRRRVQAFGSAPYSGYYDNSDNPLHVNADLIASLYEVPIFSSMADAREKFPLIGQAAFKTATSASPALPEVTATYVDPDSPDVGAV
jgi:hypothetical protein